MTYPIVLAEHDVTKIPWELAGVNYVVEATEALNSKAEAALHIRKTTKGVRMKHILEMQDANANLNGDELGPLRGGCQRVIIAGRGNFLKSPEVFSRMSEVFSHTSEVFSQTSEVFSRTSEIFSRTSEVFSYE